MFIKEKLIRLMEERNLNLAQVSKMCNIAYSTLRDLYTGKNKNPLANTLKKLSDGLNVDADYFIEEEIPENGPKQKPIDKINQLVEENKIKAMAAHFEGEEFTDEDVRDIEKFIKFVLSKKKK